MELKYAPTLNWQMPKGTLPRKKCKGCPLRCLCYKPGDDRWTIEINSRLNVHKRKAHKLLTSEDGLGRRG